MEFIQENVYAMKPKTQTIPLKVSEYIQENFKEDFLFKVKEIKEIKGQLYYFVEVSKDDYIYSLIFNEQGNLVDKIAEEAFPTDIHEEQISGDVPE
jgi:hypothetical protein